MAKFMVWSGNMAGAAEMAFTGLGALGETASADRCVLLTVGGQVRSLAGDYAAGEALFEQARAIAKELGDPRLEARVGADHAAVDYSWWRLSELVEDGARSARLLRAEGELYYAVGPLSYVCAGLNWVGSPAGAIDLAAELRPDATRVGRSTALWIADAFEAMAWVMQDGDLAEFARRSEDLVARGVQFSFFTVFFSYMELGLAHFWSGRWEEAEGPSARGSELEGATGVTQGMASGRLFQLAAYTKPKDEALSILEERREYLPRPGEPTSFGSWSLLTSAVEALAVLGERAEAAKLYELVLGAIEIGAVVTVDGSGLIETTAAIAAACGERWEQAERHFEVALRQAHEIPHRIAQPEVRRWWAWMLIDRDASGDRERARELLGEAIELYREIGMPKHLEIAERMLAGAAN